MSTFRSYFSKNATLIDNNLTNNSQNPVSEISYGTVDKQPSRLIFDIDLNPLISRINDGFINPDRIVSHVLHMTNTIQHAQEYVGRKSYSLNIERASSFELDLFNVNEEWDEGVGYDFTYNDNVYPRPTEGVPNWFNRKTNEPWTVSGGTYESGVTTIFNSQSFQKGSEDISMDITDYVNSRLGLSGMSTFTGETHGLGVKFDDNLESLETLYRQAVAFHVKNTNTFYEPYIETVISDNIVDDRNYFYLNKDNKIFLYSNQDVDINYVNIYDHEDNLITTLSGTSINQYSRGAYGVSLSVSSEMYPDSVLFRDVWNININGITKEIENQFYLMSDENYYGFNLGRDIDMENYFFYFWGIKQQEKIVAGDIRKVKLTVRELYPNQDNFIPLELEYRVFVTLGSGTELDIIPFTPVNRTSKGYEFNIDTSWFIPQDYKLQLRMKNGNYYENKEYVKFTVISNDLKK